MSLSKQELEALREQFLAELEAEHKERELRAARKAERRKNRSASRGSGRNREEESFKAEIRAQFYKEHGYEEKLDPTGRNLYLSPMEIQNKQRKRRGKKRNSRMVQKDLNRWYVHLIVAGMGIVVALLLVKSL